MASRVGSLRDASTPESRAEWARLLDEKQARKSTHPEVSSELTRAPMNAIGFDIARDLLRDLDVQKSSAVVALETAKAAAENHNKTKTKEDGLLKEGLHRGTSTSSFATDVPLGSSSRGTSSLGFP